MLCTVNILLSFLLLKIGGSDQLTRNFGSAKYSREGKLQAPFNPNKPVQFNEEDTNAIESVAQQHLNEENVQLITPDNIEQLNKETDLTNPEVPNEENQEIPLDSSKNQPNLTMTFPVLITPVKISSHKINYVQEKTGQQWPMGVVPYFIDNTVYDSITIKRIVKQMSVIESSSCVIFKELIKKPENSKDAWLHITNPKQKRECVHEFSANPADGIEVVLGFDCLYPTEILHSVLHGIGFNDEVTHPHRDQYIRIMWDNIQPKYRYLFRIRFEDAPYTLVEYDPMSIMHFHDRAFSTNGGATIATLIPGLQISSSQTLSQLDVMKLKLAFGHECNKRKVVDLLDSCKQSLLPHKMEVKAPESDAESQEKELHDGETNEKIHNAGGNSGASPTGGSKTKPSIERIPTKFGTIKGRK